MPQASVLLRWVLQCLNTRSYPALPAVQVQVLNELQQPQLIISLTEVTLKTWILGGLDARVSGILMEEFQLDYKAIEIVTGRVNPLAFLITCSGTHFSLFFRRQIKCHCIVFKMTVVRTIAKWFVF